VVSFDAVTDEYDRGRPGYPDALYDALEPLPQGVVLEGGAGTGIASRALLARGARVVAFDIGSAILGRALLRNPGLPVVVADGAAMPFRDECTELLCFAQSWHWLAAERRASEAARVLKPSGRWAAWWSHAWADGERWFDEYWEAVEAVCGATRAQRSIDWGEDLRRSGLFDVRDRVTIPWRRHVDVDSWLVDERSKSYIAALAPAIREDLLATLERLLRSYFPGGMMTVRYETWLWQASKTAGPSPRVP